MIPRLEFILAIIVPWGLQGIAIARVRRVNARRLPTGSIVHSSQSTRPEAKAPGSRWSKYGGLVGHWIADLSIIVTVLLYLLFYVVPTVNLESFTSPLVANLPEWLNWIGIFGIWFTDALNVAILSYNVNFIPCYKPMKSKYILATGGPYGVIRHPVYLSESLETIFALLATGIWLNAVGVFSWFALRRQAKAEEGALEKLFGKTYTQYKARTGMFFPKIRRRT
jgi:protein-S-isoprenylcysteine O-methyltransferase Ste14